QRPSLRPRENWRRSGPGPQRSRVHLSSSRSAPLSCSSRARPPPRSTLFPYTTLFRSVRDVRVAFAEGTTSTGIHPVYWPESEIRSEEHTSELQSRSELVCRLLLEKTKTASTSLAAAASSCSATRTDATSSSSASRIPP